MASSGTPHHTSPVRRRGKGVPSAISYGCQHGSFYGSRCDHHLFRHDRRSVFRALGSKIDNSWTHSKCQPRSLHLVVPAHASQGKGTWLVTTYAPDALCRGPLPEGLWEQRSFLIDGNDINTRLLRDLYACISCKNKDQSPLCVSACYHIHFMGQVWSCQHFFSITALLSNMTSMQLGRSRISERLDSRPTTQ